VQSGAGRCHVTRQRCNVALKLSGTEKLLPSHLLICKELARFRLQWTQRGTDYQCWHTFPVSKNRQLLLLLLFKSDSVDQCQECGGSTHLLQVTPDTVCLEISWWIVKHHAFLGQPCNVCDMCLCCRECKETELTPWCLGLMANLCRNNLSLQMFVKGKVRNPYVFFFVQYSLLHSWFLWLTQFPVCLISAPF